MVSSQSPNFSGILDEITVYGYSLLQQKAGAREALSAKARSLIAALETPIEAITWIAWAEVRTLSCC